MMKVLMLNTYDEWGGAAKAAFRLNRGLQSIGVDSRLMVQGKTTDAKDVIGSKDPLAKIAYGIRTVIGTVPVRLYPNKPVYNFSPAFMPDNLTGKVNDISPDIVHLHWLCAGFIQVETLKKFKRPLIWTLHDSWAFTGGCHMPYDCIRYRQNCGSCPVLGSRREADLSRWVWRRKNRTWHDINLTLVTPSRWLSECAGASSLFRDTRIEVIPNGLDLTIFKPIDKLVARDLLGLPQNKKYILFGGVGITSDPNKGFHFLLPALNSLTAKGWQHDAELMVFGASEPDNSPTFSMKVNYIGRVHEDISLAMIYSAADVFLAPSMQENLPYTVMESMACGTPCVAFDQGGMSDLIEHERTGYLAQPFDKDDFATGIELLLKEDGIRLEMSLNSRRKVEDMFSLDTVVKQYVQLYKEILDA